MKSHISRATIVSPPTAEPVTLNQAKKQLEMSSGETAHDEQLLGMIQEAREQWEHDTDSACLTQTLSVHVNTFWDEAIHLPSRPVQSITSIVYQDQNNETQTLSTDIYSLDPASRAVRLKYDQVWPATLYRWDAIKITYVAGFTSSSLVPAIAKRAMLLLIGRYFEDREMMTPDTMNSMAAYERLVGRFMRSNYP